MKIFKQFLAIFFRVGISIAMLIFLFTHIDSKSLLEIIKHADKPLLFLGFFIAFFSYLFCLFRWKMLLKAVGIDLPLKRVIISFAGGTFFSLFLPSTIGGDFMRTLDLSAHTRRPKDVIATVLLDRLSGYVGLVLLSLVALLVGWKFIQSKIILFSVAIITGILAAILLMLFNNFLYSRINIHLHSPNAGRIRKLIKNLHEEIYIFRNRKKVIVNNLIMSLLVQIVSPLISFVIALSLGIKINIIYFFIFLPIIGAITLLPISIGGLGLRDATTIFFFAKAGVSKDLAFAMSLISFFFLLVYGAIGGLIYVLTVHHRRIQHNQPPPL